MPRLLKLSKFLPMAGWRPTILAPRNRSSGDYRFAGPGGTAGGLAVETWWLPAPSAWARQVSARFRRAAASSGDLPEGRASDGRPGVRGTVSSKARWLLSWTSTPDELVGWLPWAVFHGLRLTRHGGVRAVLASGPPFSVVLAGAILKGLTGRPFIADFRDAWAQDPIDPLGCVGGAFRAPHGEGRKRVMARLERYAISRADAVLFTSDYTLEAYCRVYPEVRRKGTVLYNGVEESDFLSPSDTSAPFAFTYVGTLHEFQAPQLDLFLRAFALAVRDERSLAGSHVRICGHRPRGIDERIDRRARDLEIQGMVIRRGPVPHAAAVSLMKSRGALLVFAGSSRFTRPSKISDCLAVQRPIVAFGAEDSETARHMRRFGHRLYSGSSPEELAGVITDVWRAHRDDGAAPAVFPFLYPHPLHWKTTAFGLAAILDRLCRSGTSEVDQPAAGVGPQWRSWGSDGAG